MPREHIHFVTGRLAEHALEVDRRAARRRGRLRLHDRRAADHRRRADDARVDRPPLARPGRRDARHPARLLRRRPRAARRSARRRRSSAARATCGGCREFFLPRTAAARLRRLRHRDPRRDQPLPAAVARRNPAARPPSSPATAPTSSTSAAIRATRGPASATRCGRCATPGIASRSTASTRARSQPAVAAGAELVLSVNSTNRDAAADWGVEVVVMPDVPATLEGLDETVDHLARAGVPLRIDPILEPIGFGFAASLGRYLDVRRRYPDAEMMMGIGNLTELTDVDSAGVNVLLLGFCQELAIRSVLTTQVINWARTSVARVRRRPPADAPRRHAPRAAQAPRPAAGDAPRRRGRGNAGRRRSPSSPTQIRDNNYRIYAAEGEVHLVGAELAPARRRSVRRSWSSSATSGPDGGLPKNLDAGHAFYLGYEMCKAATALTLGKTYRQDEAARLGLRDAARSAALPASGRRSADDRRATRRDDAAMTDAALPCRWSSRCPTSSRPSKRSMRLARLPHVVFFDSAARDPRLGRYSFVAADPFAWIERTADDADPLAEVDALLAPVSTRRPRADLPPFQGGVAGLFGLRAGPHARTHPRGAVRRLADARRSRSARTTSCWRSTTSSDRGVDHLAGLPRDRPRRPPRPRRRRASPSSAQLLDAPPRRLRLSAVTTRTLRSAEPSPRSSPSPIPGVTSNLSADAYRAHGPPRRRVHPRRRRLSGQSRPAAALRRPRRRRSTSTCGSASATRRRTPATSTSATAQIASASPECFLTVRDRQRRNAADQGHPRPLAPARGRPVRRRRAARQREGPGRERDDRRPDAQRPVARLHAPTASTSPSSAGWKPTRSCKHLVSVVRGELQPGLHAARPAAGELSRRLDHRRPQGAGDGDHRRAGADRPRPLLRLARLPRLRRRDGREYPHPHDHRRPRLVAAPRRRRHRRPDATPTTSTEKPGTKPAGC